MPFHSIENVRLAPFIASHFWRDFSWPPSYKSLPSVRTIPLQKRRESLQNSSSSGNPKKKRSKISSGIYWDSKKKMVHPSGFAMSNFEILNAHRSFLLGAIFPSNVTTIEKVFHHVTWCARSLQQFSSKEKKAGQHFVSQRLPKYLFCIFFWPSHGHSTPPPFFRPPCFSRGIAQWEPRKWFEDTILQSINSKYPDAGTQLLSQTFDLHRQDESNG